MPNETGASPTPSNKDAGGGRRSSDCSRLAIPGGKPTEILAEQEIHCCGPMDDCGTLRVQLMDGGAGDYVVLHSSHWAFADAAEIREFAEWLCSIIPPENTKDDAPEGLRPSDCSNSQP